jgi:hypothetical protein
MRQIDGSTPTKLLCVYYSRLSHAALSLSLSLSIYIYIYIYIYTHTHTHTHIWNELYILLQKHTHTHTHTHTYPVFPISLKQRTINALNNIIWFVLNYALSSLVLPKQARQRTPQCSQQCTINSVILSRHHVSMLPFLFHWQSNCKLKDMMVLPYLQPMAATTQLPHLHLHVFYSTHVCHCMEVSLHLSLSARKGVRGHLRKQ